MELKLNNTKPDQIGSHNIFYLIFLGCNIVTIIFLFINQMFCFIIVKANTLPSVIFITLSSLCNLYG